MSEISTRFVGDASEKKFHVERVQDVEDIIEINKQLQTVDQNADWCRHVARIPNIFLEKWLNEEYARGNVHLRLFTPEMDALVDRKLKDPEWRFLRTDKKAPVAGWITDGAG